MWLYSRWSWIPWLEGPNWEQSENNLLKSYIYDRIRSVARWWSVNWLTKGLLLCCGKEDSIFHTSFNHIPGRMLIICNSNCTSHKYFLIQECDTDSYLSSNGMLTSLGPQPETFRNTNLISLYFTEKVLFHCQMLTLRNKLAIKLLD